MVVALSLIVVGLAQPAVAAADTTAPVLHSISLDSAGPFTDGDNVGYTWNATDDAGVAQVQVALLDSVGKRHTIRTLGSGSTGATGIDFSWANGQVHIDHVVLWDINDNFRFYLPDGRTSDQSGAQVPHTVDLSQTFQTFGVGDITPADLVSVQLVTPGPFTAGDTLSVAWQATDNFGVEYISVVFLDSAGKQHALQGNIGQGNVVSTTVDASWSNGPAKLAGLGIDDVNGNLSWYSWGDRRSYIPEGIGPATHGFDFSELEFETHDTGADTAPPYLNDMRLRSPGPFVEGDVVTYDWLAGDSSGVVHVQVDIADAANKGHTIYQPGPDSSGSTTINESWAIGRAQVQSIRMSDDLGNSATYFPDGRIDSVPATTGRHNVDFSQLAFVVQGKPSVAITSTPGTVSGSAADFQFGTADRDTLPEQLSASCTLDGAPQPCAISGASLRSLSAGEHLLRVTVLDPQGHVASGSYRWQVDLNAPSAAVTPPASPVVLAAGTVVRWAASDDMSGVASYDVRYQSTDHRGTVAAWVMPESWRRTTATSASTPGLVQGRTYCFQVRARDRVGNLSSWSLSACVARPLDDPALTRSSGWTRMASSAYFGGSALRSTTLNAQVKLDLVKLRRVSLIATTCPTCGSVAVYVGGQLAGKISLVSSSTRHRQVLLVPGAALRSGTVVVRVLTSGKPVLVDGLALSAV